MSTERFKAFRGAERLPTVDLTLRAEEALEAPPISFDQVPFFLKTTGSVTYQQEFSDNIFLVTGGEIPGRPNRPSDMFHIITPAVHMEIPFFPSPIMFDYSVDITQATDFHEFDTQEHHFSGTTDINIGHGFGMRIRDRADRLSAPPRLPARRTRVYFNEQLRNYQPMGTLGQLFVYDPFFQTAHLLNNYWTNTTEVAGYYKSDKLRGEARYVHELARFDARRNWGGDYNFDTVGGELSYKFMPKTSFLTEYYHEWLDNRGVVQLSTDSPFDPNNPQQLQEIVTSDFSISTPDIERDRLAAGFQWDATAKLSGRMLAGYEWVHISKARNGGGFYGHAELTYDYSQKLRLGLYGDRKIQETTFIAGNIFDGGTFTSSKVALTGLYRLYPKVALNGEIFLVCDDYPIVPERFQPRRQDDLWGLSVGLDWRPREWLNFGTKYRYQKNASSIPWDNFEENYYMWYGTLSF